jgi:hypothetical protein
MTLMRAMQDLIETFTDVGRSWFKKIVRTVVTSAATEAGLNLIIETPSDKKILFVSVGVSEKEVRDRMMKLKVRAKAVVDALLAASKNAQLVPPKPLSSFLSRISSDGVYYPGVREVNGVTQPKFLWPEEESVRFVSYILDLTLISQLLTLAPLHLHCSCSSPRDRCLAGAAIERRRTAHRHTAASQHPYNFKRHVRALFIVHRAGTVVAQHRPSLRSDQAIHGQLQAHRIPAHARLQ